MSELKMYSNGHDWVIARSPAKAIIEWSNMTGDDYILDGYGKVEDWEECDPNEEFTFVFTEWKPTKDDIPAGGRIGDADAGYGIVTATIQAWIEHENQPVYFASEDY